MTDLRRQLLWLITARAVVVTLLLGSATLVQIKAPGTLPIDPFFFLLGLIYALTVVYTVLLRQAEQRRWLVDLQLGCDSVIVSALVHLTGGVVSYFSTLYTLPIIAASVIQSWRGGMMVGVLSSVLYAGLVVGQYSGVVASPAPIVAGVATLPPVKVAIFTVGLNVFGYLAVATLSGYLAERLRRADARLQQASFELADLQAFSQHIIDSLTSGLATTSLDGTITTFNRSAEQIVGIDAAAAVGRTIAEVLQFPEPERAMFRQGGTAKLPRIDIEFARVDGRRMLLGLSTAVLQTPRGNTGFLFTFRDVTEARRQEREARVQQRLAAVGEMAAGIAHEIRNPLASMSGSLQILRQELPLTDEQAQLMDIVLRESERLNDTIRSFLAYARPQRQPASRMDVRQVLTETAALLENNPELTDAHDIVVDVPDEPIWCVADQAQIRQIVWNLATNGLRAMADGGALSLSSRVDTGTEQEAVVVIEVGDEGVGIPPTELDGILQPFRGGFAKGSGLGLSIVHRIVSDYGGELQVTSHEGRGTTVYVRLPVAAAAEAAAV
jgi:two-component system, NtrC family, sensor histidine kinase PilS